jgi:hypothetical protein
MEAEVYISMQEDNKHLVVQGQLTLLEKLLRALRSNHDYVEMPLAARAERAADGDTLLQKEASDAR